MKLNKFNRLIEALKIFNNYPSAGTNCEHDELFVTVDPCIVSKQDTKKLGELGFIPNPHTGCFYSFEWGSC